MKYKVQRVYLYKPGYRYTLLNGLTLEQAQAHCSSPESSSNTCTSQYAKAVTKRNGPWFDSYAEDK